MKTSLFALLALLLCTFSGFAMDNSIVDVHRVYTFTTIDREVITAKVLRKMNENWIEIQYDNKARYLNLSNVVLIQDIVIQKK